MQPTNTSVSLLPRAVRRQLKAMDDHVAARSAAAASPAPGPNAAPAASPTAEPGAPAAPAAAAPAVPATPAQPAAAPSTADAREGSVDYWRERFRVMQGVNESLRNEHRTALAGRDQELADLRQRVQELEQASSSPAQSRKLDLSLFFKPEVIEQFGEQQCEAMAQAAITAAGQQAQQIIEHEVKPIKERAKADDAAKAKQREDAFWANLDGLIARIPEAGNRTIWEINEEDAWKQFLREADADGEIRQARLTRLQNTLNAQGVANLFAEYLKKATHAAPTPPVAPGGGAGNGGDDATAA